MAHDPLQFRRSDTQAIIEFWKRPVSVSVVGVGSVGKSNFFQNLASPELETHVRSSLKRPAFRAIAVDPNLLGTLPPMHGDEDGDEDAEAIPPEQEATPAAALARRYWVGCELVFSRLYDAFAPFDLLGDDGVRSINELYDSFNDGRNPLFIYLGLRYLELALDHFMRRDAQIVFLFDDFEQMLAQLPVQFFLGLRGLRDAYKDRLSFVTFTRAPLPEVVERMGINALAIEPFIELFNDNVHYLGAYAERDARAALDTMAARKGKQYNEMQQNYLLWVSGGYAGLMRSAAGILDTLGAITMDNLANDREALLERLLARGVVRSECATLWHGLNAHEHAILKAIAGGQQQFRLDNVQTKDTFDHLLRKGLVRLNRDQRLTVEPPLFAAYVGSERAVVGE